MSNVSCLGVVTRGTEMESPRRKWHERREKSDESAQTEGNSKIIYDRTHYHTNTHLNILNILAQTYVFSKPECKKLELWFGEANKHWTRHVRACTFVAQYSTEYTYIGGKRGCGKIGKASGAQSQTSDGGFLCLCNVELVFGRVLQTNLFHHVICLWSIRKIQCA